jgi:8-oxo-dGTP pyrophosphatase MutT (NUDIX family)
MKAYYYIASLLNPLFLLIIQFKTRKNPKPRLRAVIRNKEGKVLLVAPVVGEAAWELPGGAAKRLETQIAAVAREIREETSLSINPESFEHFLDLMLAYPMRIFKAEVEGLSPRVSRPFEIKEIGWFAPEALPRGIATHVAEAITLLDDDRSRKEV